MPGKSEKKQEEDRLTGRLREKIWKRGGQKGARIKP